MASSENIFLFIPNLIGYLRIVSALAAFYYMRTNVLLSCCWYALSALLDAFDGYAARLFDQSTRFGAVLDQITDRCATLCLVMTLSVLYPRYLFVFHLVSVIDIGGHWIHIWASLLKGRESHKSIDDGQSSVLQIYYSSRPILFFMCAGNEMFYLSLYISYFFDGPTLFGKLPLFPFLVKLTFPIAAIKLCITLVQVYEACVTISKIDVAERIKLQSGKSN